MAVQPQLGGNSGSRQFPVFTSLLQNQTSALGCDSTLGFYNVMMGGSGLLSVLISRFMIYLWMDSLNNLDWRASHITSTNKRCSLLCCLNFMLLSSSFFTEKTLCQWIFHYVNLFFSPFCLWYLWSSSSTPEHHFFWYISERIPSFTSVAEVTVISWKLSRLLAHPVRGWSCGFVIT